MRFTRDRYLNMGLMDGIFSWNFEEKFVVASCNF